ncbi:hypothetical protein ACFL2V_08850 [Pseudomonadota bacterium]
MTKEHKEEGQVSNRWHHEACGLIIPNEQRWMALFLVQHERLEQS